MVNPISRWGLGLVEGLCLRGLFWFFAKSFWIKGGVSPMSGGFLYASLLIFGLVGWTVCITVFAKRYDIASVG
jgi:hypothetical protein